MANVTDFLQGQAVAASEDSAIVNGGQTAPGAGVVIATINAPSTGMYDIKASCGYGATPETAVDNMELAINGVSVLTLPSSASANGPRTLTQLRRKLVGGQAVAVRAIAAGAVGSIYRATIVLTKVSA